MENINIQPSQNILLLWDSAQGSALPETVKKIEEKVGQSGRVQCENISMLNKCKHLSLLDILNSDIDDFSKSFCIKF